MAAFCRRARTIGNIKTTGVTEEFYDEAMQAARVVDEGRSTQHRDGGGGGDGNVGLGLLQGLPISIKDAMNMKGAVRKRPGFVLFFAADCCLRGRPTSPVFESYHLPLRVCIQSCRIHVDDGFPPPQMFCVRTTVLLSKLVIRCLGSQTVGTLEWGPGAHL